ncbi:hypothetical protein BYT27DRAFT_6698323 [Phlegmacium glaucopus]|nr:hypothetical protein BYT27DRAFT_6698323 [Phlegmacium glaucopus]
MSDSKDKSGNDPSETEGPPPVFKLTNDLLAYIFLMNATRSDRQSIERAATTLASSQVCTIWRSVALGYPTLWNCIIDYHGDSLDWIDELLRRSDPSLFDFGSRVRSVALSEDRLGVLELVFNHSSRLRTFSLQTPTANWELVRSRFLQKPAPNLEFFNFCVLFDNGRVFRDPLFDNHAPSLRHFHLRRCAVDFTSPVLTLLTELYVHQITLLDAAPTVTAWLDLLGEMAFLRRITIIDAISHAVAQTELPIIHLVHLEKLSVEGGFHESVTLINQVITPPSCGLRLRCNHAHFGPEQKMLWAMIDKKLDFWEKDAPHRRFIAKLNEKSFAIGNLVDIDSLWEVSKAEELEYKRILPLDPLLAVSLRSDNSDDAISLFLSLFGLFERTFSATIYLTLWMDYSGVNGLEVFRPLVERFRSFVNLKTLGLANDSHSYLFPLLQDISSPGSVLLPVLHTVYFVTAFFRRRENLTQVAAFLQSRREQGFPIQKVDIYESRVDRNLVLSQLGEVEVKMDDNDSDTDTDGE